MSANDHAATIGEGIRERKGAYINNESSTGGDVSKDIHENEKEKGHTLRGSKTMGRTPDGTRTYPRMKFKDVDF